MKLFARKVWHRVFSSLTTYMRLGVILKATSNNCLFARFLRYIEILILEIFIIFIRLKFQWALNSIKNPNY